MRGGQNEVLHRDYYLGNMRIRATLLVTDAVPGGRPILVWDEVRGCPALRGSHYCIPLAALEFMHPRSGQRRSIPATKVSSILRQEGQTLTAEPGRTYDSRWEKLWYEIFPIPPEQVRTMEEGNRDFVAALARELGIGKGSSVLELACGHAWFSDLMAEHAGFACATDLSLPNTLKANSNYALVRFFVSDMLRLPKLRHRFDLIFQFACSAAERETDF